MEFENLKYFFDSEITLNIKTKGKVEGSYINFQSISKNGNIMFSVLNSNNDLLAGYISENDAHRLSNITNSSTDYFAKIVKTEKETITVNIISFNKIPNNEDIEIGVGDIGISFSSTDYNINNNYLIEICGKKYYIHGTHINSNESIFSIISPTKKYDVVLSRREECGAVLDPKTAHEQIWAIRKKEANYKKEDYVFQIRPFNLEFTDVSSANAATQQNQIEMQNLDKNSILGRWEHFAEMDLEISKEKIEEIGILTFSNFEHCEGNIYKFEITNGTQRLKNLKEFATKQTSTITFNVYNSIDEIDQTKRKLARPELSEIVHNTLICYYDGDVIIKNTGFLQLSNRGNETIYFRRKEAIDRIKSNNAAKPNIIQLMEGAPLHSSNTSKKYYVNDFMKEIKDAFGGKIPNKSQLDAIEMAINTPDFAIIQGPPGCGKTSLINAIDECLSKIDSTYHSKSSSLSTAYQKESTKNMVAKKFVNGLPVPFISKSSDKTEIELNFIEYIENISQKLKEKYPKLVNELEKSILSDNLSTYVGHFNYESATYESLLFFINNVLDYLKETTYFEQIDKLKELQKKAQNQLNKFLEPINDECIYYIRRIPSSTTHFEDCGMNSFFTSKMYLCSLNKELEPYLIQIETILKQELIDFESIKDIKNEMIFLIKNKKKLDKNIEMNKLACNIVYEIKELEEKERTYDNNALLTSYIDTFLHNPVRARYALEPWITSIAATHQISSDSKAINQGTNNKNVVYNNVLIDEAARSCPPDLLIPITCAKNRIIMVGDHKQLPQFINDEVLKRLELDKITKQEMKRISMFEYLIETTKKLQQNDLFKRFIALNNQYRMPKILGDFIGEHFYKDISLSSPRGNPCDDENFIQTMPYIENKCMVWCDVPYGKENNENKSWKNKEEASIIATLLNKFLHDEKNKKLTIGVISFYKEQVKEIQEQLISHNIYIKEDSKIKINDIFEKRLKIDTVDAFQGLESDVIILSMVRSNPLGKFKKGSFGFLEDEHRLCVALSRQKRCLVIVGNGSGMLNTELAETCVEPLVNFYKICEKGGEYVEIIQSKDII